MLVRGPGGPSGETAGRTTTPRTTTAAGTPIGTGGHSITGELITTTRCGNNCENKLYLQERDPTIEMINDIFMMIVIIFYYLQIQRGRTYYSAGYQDDYASFRSSLEGLPNFFILRGGTFY